MGIRCLRDFREFAVGFLRIFGTYHISAKKSYGVFIHNWPVKTLPKRLMSQQSSPQVFPANPFMDFSQNISNLSCPMHRRYGREKDLLYITSSIIVYLTAFILSLADSTSVYRDASSPSYEIIKLFRSDGSMMRIFGSS